MERVIRVRGATRDENDAPVPGSEISLRSIAIRPGATLNNREMGRNGSKVNYTVFFWGKTDIKDGDKLRVRGQLFEIAVLDWRSPHTGRRGFEVLCSLGKG